MLFSLLKWIITFFGHLTLQDRILWLSFLFGGAAGGLTKLWHDAWLEKERVKAVKKRMAARLVAARMDANTATQNTLATRLKAMEDHYYAPILGVWPGNRLAVMVRQGPPPAEGQRFTLPPQRPERLVTYLLAVLLIFVTLFSIAQHAPFNGLVLGVLIDAALVGLCWYRAYRAQQAFTEQIPEVFNSLAMSVRTMELERAFLDVSQRLPDPAAAEFRIVYNEIRHSLRTKVALDHLLERRPSADLRMGVTSILVQEELGGSLSPVLSTIADAIRTRRRAEAEIRNTTLHARSTVAIVAVIAPALVVIMGIIFPGYFIPLLKSSAGPGLIFLASMGELIGVVWTLLLARNNY